MRNRLAKYLVVVAALSITIGILDRMFPPDQSRYREASLEILARDGEPLRVFTTRDGMLRLATLPDDVDPRYLNLLLQVEDRHFWRHPGVDPLALARAVWQLIRQGHVVSGGSTLTMQVARLLSPHRHDVVGKLTDIARAMQLEARFTKREILAMYLTLAPMGGNLEGVRSASRIYFGREPDHLSPVQAALLVAIPQSPSRLRPDRHPDAATLAVARICARTPTANCGDTSDFPKIMGSDLHDTRIILLMLFDRKATPSARGRHSMRHFKLVSKAWRPGRHAFLVITPTYRCWLSITVTARFSPMLAGATILVRLVWSIWYAPCALLGRR